MILIQPKPESAPIRVRDSRDHRIAQQQLDGVLKGRTLPPLEENTFRRLMDENPAMGTQLVKVYRAKLGLQPPDDFPIDVKVM